MLVFQVNGLLFIFAFIFQHTFFGVMKQTTINQAVSISGVGLHTGKPATLTFQPAPVDHGYRIQRIDLPDQPIINADVSRVVNTERSTTIQNGSASISTIEHVLSALYGLGIDNVLLQIDGPEMPIMDGSAAPFVNILQATGITEQEADREYFVIDQPLTYRDEGGGRGAA